MWRRIENARALRSSFGLQPPRKDTLVALIVPRLQSIKTTPAIPSAPGEAWASEDLWRQLGGGRLGGSSLPWLQPSCFFCSPWSPLETELMSHGLGDESSHPQDQPRCHQWCLTAVFALSHLLGKCAIHTCNSWRQVCFLMTVLLLGLRHQCRGGGPPRKPTLEQFIWRVLMTVTKTQSPRKTGACAEVVRLLWYVPAGSRKHSAALRTSHNPCVRSFSPSPADFYNNVTKSLSIREKHHLLSLPLA